MMFNKYIGKSEISWHKNRKDISAGSLMTKVNRVIKLEWNTYGGYYVIFKSSTAL